jgi:transcriptional antiterminator RfaH
MRKNQWYILQYKPNSHVIAQQNLKRQGFRTFLPLEQVTKYQFGRIKIQQKPLFPGYMFVNINENNTSWTKINSTRGVSKLLMMNNTIGPIDKELVSELIKRCDISGKLLPPSNLKKGDQIRITNSLFAEYITKIEHIDTKNRIWVFLDIMGRKSRTQLSPEKIKTY